MEKDNLNKLLRTFEDDFIDFSDEYFKNSENLEKIAKNKTSIEELVELQRKYFMSFWFKKPISTINKKEKPYDTFSLDITCAITGTYDPDDAYLRKIIDLLEQLAKGSNKKYLVSAFSCDPADTYGASAHSNILAALVVDNKYFFTWNPVHGDKFILSSDKRFSGLIPFLYYNNHQELYERAFQFCRLVMKTFSYKSGRMVLALLNFLKENDSERYNVFKKDFDTIKRQDESAWNRPLLYGDYGNGFEIKKEYWDIPFMDTIE